MKTYENGWHTPDGCIRRLDGVDAKDFAEYLVLEPCIRGYVKYPIHLLRDYRVYMYADGMLHVSLPLDDLVQAMPSASPELIGIYRDEMRDWDYLRDIRITYWGDKVRIEWDNIVRLYDLEGEELRDIPVEQRLDACIDQFMREDYFVRGRHLVEIQRESAII